MSDEELVNWIMADRDRVWAVLHERDLSVDAANAAEDRAEQAEARERTLRAALEQYRAFEEEFGCDPIAGRALAAAPAPEESGS